MTMLYDIARPFLMMLDPETAYRLTIKAMKTNLIKGAPVVNDPALEVSLWCRKFPNPLGSSAALDKNAEIIAPTLKLGFGFTEVGGVTPLPQKGNARPRVFRDELTHSIINYMNFPNVGLEQFQKNLEKFLIINPRPPGLVGINITRNADQTELSKDYLLLVKQLGPLADYLSVNVSCPNTQGLQALQEKETLRRLLSDIIEERNKTTGQNRTPILVKLSSDLTTQQQEDIAPMLLEVGIDGLILANTSMSRPDRGLPTEFAARKGGLSGPFLRDLSTQLIRNFYVLTDGKLPIIGGGGISSAADAYAKIRAGASLVQLYTALVFLGPRVVWAVNSGLIELLQRDGLANISEAVGLDAHEVSDAA